MWKKGFILLFIFMLGIYQINVINTLKAVAETSQVEGDDQNEEISEVPETERTEENEGVLEEKEVQEDKPEGIESSVESIMDETKNHTLNSFDEAEETITNDSSPIPEVIADDMNWGTAPTRFDSDTGTLTVEAGELANDNYPNIDLTQVKTITFEEPTQTLLPANSSYLFAGNYHGTTTHFINVEAIHGSDSLNTSNVVNMGYMFLSANHLKNLDLNNWDTSNVTTMNDMFYHTEALNSLNITDWNTGKVTDMSFMFFHAESLESLDIGQWNVSNVKTMNAMFNNAKNLTTLNLSNWDTNNVTNIGMGAMFYEATKLNRLTLGKNFIFKLGSHPSLPIIRSDIYTGKWVLDDFSRSQPVVHQSSTEFVNNYDGSTASGTYFWQSNPDNTRISVKDTAIARGTNWTPADNFLSAIDETGSHPIPVSKMIIPGQVNTEQSGEYEVIYSYRNKSATATITVTEPAMPEINVTIPTSMLFGTFDKKSTAISSEDYAIINNSDEARTQIDIASFTPQESSSNTLTLLEENDEDPIDGSPSARLHVYVDNNLKINSLTEATQNAALVTLEPKQKTMLKFGGQYFGDPEEKHQIDHQMKLKFSVVS